METVLTISLFTASVVLAVLGFMLKAAYNSATKDIEGLMQSHSRHNEELGKLKGKIELVQQENQLKYQAIQELTQLEIKNLAKSVGELSEAVKSLLKSHH
jgi:uncharacterized protein YoxC